MRLSGEDVGCACRPCLSVLLRICLARVSDEAVGCAGRLCLLEECVRRICETGVPDDGCRMCRSDVSSGLPCIYLTRMSSLPVGRACPVCPLAAVCRGAQSGVFVASRLRFVGVVCVGTVSLA